MADEGLAWDGQGEDPWVPQRLDRLLGLSDAERAVRRVMWGLLSKWIVGTSRAVLRGVRPDPTAVFSRDREWQEAVSEFEQEALLPLIRSAYTPLLGEGFPFEARPFVTKHLAEVSNRLVRTPDEVFDLVSGEVAQGVNLGESIDDLRTRIDDVLSTTATPRWENRATVIARTETIGAMNGARDDSFKAVIEETGEEFEKLWLSTDDARTRPEHVRADLQRVPVNQPFMVGGEALSYPGDPAGSASNTIQCLPGDTVVSFGSIRAVTRRWFEGEMITVSFAGGDYLAITPNHPVLRSDGHWYPAGLLVEGDHCVRSLDGGELFGQPDKDGGPAKISDLYGSACEATEPNWVSATPPDFHGDGSNGQVQVVPVNGDLIFYGQPATDQEVEQFGLSFAHFATLGSGSSDGRPSPPVRDRLEVGGGLPNLGVGSSSDLPSFLASEATHPDLVSFTSPSRLKPNAFQPSEDGGSAGVEGLSQRQDTFSPVVSLSKIVKIDRYDFSGHVYNLDTGVGWYIANGTTVRNCRCTQLLVRPGESTDLSNRQFGG